MKILLRYLKPYIWYIILILVLATVAQVASLFEPIPLQWIIDRYITKMDQHSQSEIFKGVGMLLGLSVGVAMIARLGTIVQDYWLSVTVDRISNEIYNDGIKKALKMPFEIYEDEQSGKTLSIIQKVWTDSKELMKQFINFIFPTIVSVIFIIFFAIKVHWLIAPIYIAAMAIIIIFSLVLGKRIKIIQKDIVTRSSELAGTTTEVLRNIEMVKGLGLVKQEYRRLKENTGKILGLEIEKSRKTRGLLFGQGTLIQVSRTVLTGFLVYLTIKKEITLGELVTFRMLTYYLFAPLSQIGNVINKYREAQVSLENFESLMKRPTETNNKNGVKIDRVQKIEFKDVSFTRKGSSELTLKNINFEVKSGQNIAFVGPSGAGKSTLVKLLIGFYEASEGGIKYNGFKKNEINIQSLRTELGLVSQDNYMFAGSIRDNLKFVKPDATDEEMVAALKTAQAGKLLERAENGLDTLIGENGMKISGGEKQRLSIARAILRKPSLLIFDEATSALDSITEKEIVKIIQDVSNSKDRLSISIAHRLSTIMHCDKIYVLEKGRVCEMGTHSELLKKQGLYSALWREQSGSQN